MEYPTSPTPPLPIRNPSHHYHQHHHDLPPIPKSPSTAGLIPPPLFTRRRRTFIAPDAIRVAVLEISSHSTPPQSPRSSTSSWHHASPSSSPSLSAPTSPNARPRSYSAAFSSSSFTTSAWGPQPLSSPPILRRKPSPKMATLRALRAKESDACLQQIYDRQTCAYLDGTLFASKIAKSKLGTQMGD